jgi:hypothetical protein
MTLSENRISGASVATGCLVALALAAMAIGLGAAILASSETSPFDAALSAPDVLVACLCGALALGALVGGRAAAIAARVRVRQDGLIAGLATWGALTVVVLLACAAWVALEPVSAARLEPHLSTALWALFVSQVASLGSALLGGFLGARAIARDTGYEPAIVAVPEIEVSTNTYERRFLDDEPISGTP